MNKKKTVILLVSEAIKKKKHIRKAYHACQPSATLSFWNVPLVLWLGLRPLSVVVTMCGLCALSTLGIDALEFLLLALKQKREFFLLKIKKKQIVFFLSWRNVPTFCTGRYVYSFDFSLVRIHLCKHLLYSFMQTFFPSATTFQWEEEAPLPISKASVKYFNTKTQYLRRDSLVRFHLTYSSHLCMLQCQEVGLNT